MTLRVSCVDREIPVCDTHDVQMDLSATELSIVLMVMYMLLGCLLSGIHACTGFQFLS
jgi:hypothetical protein